MIVASSSCNREEDATDALIVTELEPQPAEVPPSIVIQTQFVEIESETVEDLGFDWIVELPDSNAKMAEQGDADQPDQKAEQHGVE